MHLIFYDTSPLKVFMQMCTMRTFCAHGEVRESRGVTRLSVHNVHVTCTLCTRVQGSQAAKEKANGPAKKVAIHILPRH